jgi:hypothetical protein
MSPGETGGDPDEGPERDGRTVRPYLLTGGRTRPSGGDLPIEALVVVTGRGSPVDGGSPGSDDPTRPAPTREHRLILEACRTPTSIAEIAVLLAVPVGVARVLVGDLAVTGQVEVCDTATRVEHELVRRLIAGVRAI